MRYFPLKSLLCTILIILTNCYSTLSLSNEKNPLRIWVMPNGSAKSSQPITKSDVIDFVQQMREKEGIIIENTVRDLMMQVDSGTNIPLFSYVNKSVFLSQISEYLKSFSNTNPIAIEFVRWKDFYQRFVNAMDAKNIAKAPDILQIGSTWIATFIENGYLIPVDKWFNSNDFFRPSIESASLAGKKGFYAVPWFIDARILYYRKDLIKNPEIFKSWRNFEEGCKIWRNTKAKLIAFPILVEWNLIHNLAPWIWSGGGDIIKPNRFGPFHYYAVNFDSPGSFEGIKYLHKISQLGCADYVNMPLEGLEKEFIAGKYAAIISGPWAMTIFDTVLREKYSFTSIPAGAAGSITFVGGSHLGISKYTKQRGNLDESLELIKFITGPENLNHFSLATGFLPSRKTPYNQLKTNKKVALLNKIISTGRTYPSMPEWGSIVERDVIRNHLSILWNQIATVQPLEILSDTVKTASGELRKRLFLRQMQKFFPAIITLFGIILCLFIWQIKRSKNSYLNLLDKKISLDNELKQITANKDILEGKLLLLKRQQSSSTNHISQLSKKIESVSERANKLNDELRALKQKEDKITSDIFSKLDISWDGTLSVTGNKIHFDSTRQAKRLIEHLVRQTLNNQTNIHCLWGYYLFGWEPGNLHLSPNRLFNTSVSKLNAPLKNLGFPPLLVSEGKGKLSWKLTWDKEALINRSHIYKAKIRAVTANEAFKQGRQADALEMIIEALELDPLCTEGFQLINYIKSKDFLNANPLAKKADAAFKRGKRLFDEKITRIDTAIKSIEALPSNINECFAGNPERFNEEMSKIKYYADYLKDTFRDCFEKTEIPNSEHINTLLNYLRTTSRNIDTMQSKGFPKHVIWSNIVNDDNFVRFTNYPNINQLINNFYNREIKSVEDPRLVKLAIIMTLEQASLIKKLNTITDESDLVNEMKSLIEKQLVSLQKEFLAIPDYS